MPGYNPLLANACLACGLFLHKRKCMRPKENWEKAQRDSDRRRKRSDQQKKAKRDSLSSHPGSDASQSAGDGQSNASTPAPAPTDGANEKSVHRMSPQLPVFRRPRASSVQESPINTKSGLPEASAALALQKAIQSSPARLIGTQSIPIDVEQLTPKPTRRVLFPTPPKHDITKAAPLDRLAFAKDSKLISSHSQDVSDQNDHDQNDKENHPPSLEQQDPALDNLFEEAEEHVPRPTTPTPISSTHGSGSLKTPKNSITPHRLPPTTGDFFSSTAKAILQHPTTPRRSIRSSSSQPLGEVTPFTAHLNQLFSEGIGSPSANYDFPSLPSLHNTPGRTGNDYSFANFDSQDFFSTDAPMPSSPPGLFGVYEDPDEQDTNDLVIDYRVRGDEDMSKALKTPKASSLLVDR